MKNLRIQRHVQRYPPFALAAALILTLGFSAPKARGQQESPGDSAGISVQTSPQLFATMCALDAAGFGADESTLAEMPARLALREDLLKMQGPAADAVRQFYHSHVMADPSETLSQYIAFAMVAGPPPRFEFTVDRDSLPPDVLSIEGFQDVLVDFYQAAGLEARWREVEPEYDSAAARYAAPLHQIVMISNGYLREIIKTSTQRTFTLYVEPLVGNLATFRNYGDHYAIVVGSGPQMPLDEIRHAYLHFLLDPLVLEYRAVIMTKSPLLNIAAHAPRLPAEYQDDFAALMDECLVKAVELRLNHLSPEKLEAALEADDNAGYILVRPLVAQLEKFEKAEPAMSYYFPELISGISVQNEAKRLQNFAFAPVEQNPALQPRSPDAFGQLSELDVLLAEGDHDIALKNAQAAQVVFQRVLMKYPDQPRAIYGLAISSVLLGDADRARDLFERLVSPPDSGSPGSQSTAEGTDPTILAWSHLYLGRIHDLSDERDLAVSEYRAVLAVKGAPEAALVAAEGGIAAPYKPVVPASQSAPKQP